MPTVVCGGIRLLPTSDTVLLTIGRSAHSQRTAVHTAIRCSTLFCTAPLYFGVIGRNTWSRTKTHGIKVRCPTIRLCSYNGRLLIPTAQGYFLISIIYGLSSYMCHICNHFLLSYFEFHEDYHIIDGSTRIFGIVEKCSESST